ncbi:MAG: TolC family protein [Verrucomicrobia bacterium]|nr:TolC family protein [Verrucomicrobiota bacterium]
MTITIEDAVLMALENNRALSVQRLNPDIERTFEQQERAAFDPVFSADASVNETDTDDRTGAAGGGSSTSGAAGVRELLPTGTMIELGLTTGPTPSAAAAAGDQTTHAALTVTQALLKGRGVAVNLADLRQARLDTQFSEYELRGFAEALVAEVEETYWDYVLARRQVEILNESLNLAQQQFDETRQRIRVGDLAETELAAAEAEVALRREALINARSTVDTLAARLARLIRPSAPPSAGRQVTPQSEPTVSAESLEPLEEHIAVGLQMRPDLNQARLLVQRGTLNLVKTKNGLLPRMDLFVSLGKTGYADSFGRSVSDLGEGDDLSVGLSFDYALGNRAERARHRSAVLTQQQLDESLRNTEDLVRQDVELAYIEVSRARQQVDATATTRKFQEEKLRAEMAKFRVGRSTALLVAQAQRDLVVSQVSEVAATTNYLKARTDLFLKEGSLLERRGVSAPGRQPVQPDRSQ